MSRHTTTQVTTHAGAHSSTRRASSGTVDIAPAGTAEPDHQHVEAVAGAVHASLLDTRPGEDLDEKAIRSRLQNLDPLLSARDLAWATDAVLARLHGLGPLEQLLADSSVTEVMVNGPGPVWVERGGSLARTAVVVSRSTIDGIIERIVAPLGLRVDRTSPVVDARLPDGSRVNVVVPPLAIDGPYVTIRRFAVHAIPVSNFCSTTLEGFLRSAVIARRNIVVSGGTGAGKTTLLNALAESIGRDERVVTIEDAAELQLPGDHVVRLEARPANGEGVGHFGTRLLLRNALRMRPDRIILGEVRGPEALEMVQAMNTGHAGSLSSCHASSPSDAMRRLETMVLQADVALPLPAIRDHLSSAIDLIVQVERTAEGCRRITEVVELLDGDVRRQIPIDEETAQIDGDTRQPRSAAAHRSQDQC